MTRYTGLEGYLVLGSKLLSESVDVCSRTVGMGYICRYAFVPSIQRCRDPSGFEFRLRCKYALRLQVTVVFAQEERKRPDDMRRRDGPIQRGGFGGRGGDRHGGEMLSKHQSAMR